jgi:hypothetical protein
MTNTRESMLTATLRKLTVPKWALLIYGTDLNLHVSAAESMLNEVRQALNSEQNKLCEAIGFYHLYYTKDPEKAFPFLQRAFLNAAENTLEHANILCMIGTASYQMNKDYVDSSFFTKALEIIKILPENSATAILTVNCERYITLITCRQLPANKNINVGDHIVLTGQLAALNSSIDKLQATYLSEGAVVIFELAESTQALATLQAQLHKLDESKVTFENSIKYWRALPQKANHINIDMYYTHQSFGTLLTRLGNLDDALIHLQTACAGLQHYLKNDLRAEIANTFFLLGNTFELQENYAAALAQFTNAHRIFRELQIENKLIKLTQQHLLNVMTKLPNYDWETSLNVSHANQPPIQAAALNELMVSEITLEKTQELALARHFVNVGSYYVHNRFCDSQAAAIYIKHAITIFERHETFDAWAYNHLAACLQLDIADYHSLLRQSPENLEFTECKKEKIKEALALCKKVAYAPTGNYRDRAFAFQVAAHILQQEKNPQAKKYFCQALGLYQLELKRDDDAYATTKYIYAEYLADNNDPDALTCFEELEEYWSENANSLLTAIFYALYGKFLLQKIYIADSQHVDFFKPFNLENILRAIKKLESAFEMLGMNDADDDQAAATLHQTIAHAYYVYGKHLTLFSTNNAYNIVTPKTQVIREIFEKALRIFESYTNTSKEIVKVKAELNTLELPAVNLHSFYKKPTIKPEKERSRSATLASFSRAGSSSS